ncbi:hypothetical protein BC833DRAFT_598366 [Globomyces pollinis-pini]|nr:hypothetical protein BC833DRAFT_598366 [Globomyces pollinis-pini]
MNISIEFNVSLLSFPVLILFLSFSSFGKLNVENVRCIRFNIMSVNRFKCLFQKAIQSKNHCKVTLLRLNDFNERKVECIIWLHKVFKNQVNESHYKNRLDSINFDII